MKLITQRLALLVLIVLWTVTPAAAQSGTVTLPGGDTYRVTTIGNNTTVNKLDGGGVRGLHPYELTDPSVKGRYDNTVTLYAPILLGPLNSELNMWPTTIDYDTQYARQPLYPLELYMQMYPFLFPQPTVAQARLGTDLWRKYQVRVWVSDPMNEKQFLKWQAGRIKKAEKAEAKAAKRK